MPTADYPALSNIMPMNVGMGTYNALMDQSENAQINDKLNQQKALQDYLYAQQDNPLKLQSSQLQNENQGFLNRINAVKAGSAEKTQASDIAKTISGNQAEDQANQVKHTQMLSQHFSQLADMVDSGAVHPLDIQDKVPPEIAQLLTQPGGTQKIRQMSQALALHSHDQLQRMQSEQAKTASQERIERIRTASQERIAHEAVIAGKYDKAFKYQNSLQNILQKSRTMEEFVAHLESAKMFNEDPDIGQKLDQALGNAKSLWQAKLNSGYKPAVDPGATASTGTVINTQPVKVPGANGDNKPDPLGIR